MAPQGFQVTTSKKPGVFRAGGGVQGAYLRRVSSCQVLSGAGAGGKFSAGCG